jgi:hypothetical protein
MMRRKKKEPEPQTLAELDTGANRVKGRNDSMACGPVRASKMKGMRLLP